MVQAEGAHRKHSRGQTAKDAKCHIKGFGLYPLGQRFPNSVLPVPAQIQSLESRGNLLTIQIHSPDPRESGSVGLGCSPEIFLTSSSRDSEDWPGLGTLRGRGAAAEGFEAVDQCL